MSIDPISCLALTDARLKDIKVPPLVQSKKRQGYFSCTPQLDGKDIVIQSPVLSAKGYGVSAPNPEQDIKGYSIDASMQAPPCPPPGPDGTPDVTKFNTRAKIIDYFEKAINGASENEHKFFQMLFRINKWFQALVKERSVEFLGDENPTDKELNEKVVHPVKFAVQQRKFAENLQYGPKFSPEIRGIVENIATGGQIHKGFECEAFDPNNNPINIVDLVKRRFTMVISVKMSSIWKMPSTGRCGIKFHCLRIDVIQFFDTAVTVNVNRNMYGEIPDSAMIAAAEAAEAAYANAQNEEDDEPPQEALVEASPKREREEEEEEEQEEKPTKPTKKGKTAKK